MWWGSPRHDLEERGVSPFFVVGCGLRIAAKSTSTYKHQGDGSAKDRAVVASYEDADCKYDI